MHKERPARARDNFSAGYSLLEVFFVIGIMALIFVALYGLVNISLRVLWENKAREGAVALANQKIEMARNLPYNAVGTLGGVVSGGLIENEQVVRNGIVYNVYTNVVYVDDPFDGTWASEPPDSLGNDYKRLSVSVSWESGLSREPVVFYTDIAPRGVESALGGGTLVLTVFDSNGLPVNEARILITNESLIPPINMTAYTNMQGQLVLPGAPRAIETYGITVSKAGYSSDMTLAASVELPAPLKPQLTVFEGQATSASFSIDWLAELSVLAQDVNGLALGDLTLNLRGNKLSGHDGEGKPVYKYDEFLATDAQGRIYIPDLEWDTYQFSIAEESGYNIAQTDPVQPFVVAAGSEVSSLVTLEPRAAHSLIVVVKDINANPLNGAAVRARNSFGFDQTKITGSAGQSFFSPLAEATTTVEVTLAGYSDYANEFSLTGYVTEPVTMVVE